MPHEDQKYIVALQNNNEALIKEIRINCFGSLKNYVLKNNGDINDAEDLFQTSLIRVWETVRKKDVVLTSSFCSYFYGFYRNIWLNILRGREKMKIEEIKEIEIKDTKDEVNLEDTENELSLEDRRLLVFNGCLKKLSKNCQELYKLQFEGKNAKKIAQFMGISKANAVYQKKFDCNKKLKKLILAHPDFKTLHFDINT